MAIEVRDLKALQVALCDDFAPWLNMLVAEVESAGGVVTQDQEDDVLGRCFSASEALAVLPKIVEIDLRLSQDKMALERLRQDPRTI